jgi:hypothetical protein
MYRSRSSDLGTSWRIRDQLHAPATLTLGKEPPVPIGQEVGHSLNCRNHVACMQ